MSWLCLIRGIIREVGGRVGLHVDTDTGKKDDERECGGEHRGGVVTKERREKGEKERKEVAVSQRALGIGILTDLKWLVQAFGQARSRCWCAPFVCTCLGQVSSDAPASPADGGRVGLGRGPHGAERQYYEIGNALASYFHRMSLGGGHVHVDASMAVARRSHLQRSCMAHG